MMYLTVCIPPPLPQTLSSDPRTSHSSRTIHSYEQLVAKRPNTSQCGAWGRRDDTCQVVEYMEYMEWYAEYLINQPIFFFLPLRVPGVQSGKGLLRDVSLARGLLWTDPAGGASVFLLLNSDIRKKHQVITFNIQVLFLNDHQCCQNTGLLNLNIWKKYRFLLRYIIYFSLWKNIGRR